MRASADVDEPHGAVGDGGGVHLERALRDQVGEDLADLKDANSKLKDQLDDLRKQVESLAAPDAKE